MRLTDAKIKKLKPMEKTTRHADGGGLSILLKPSGARLWRFRYRFAGKHKELAWGKYPDIPLTKAREKRARARAMIADGIDPGLRFKQERAETAARAADTFSNIADELIEKLRKEGKSTATLEKKRWLLDMAIKDFGDEQTTALQPSTVLKTLKTVEQRGHYETAHRLRSTIGQVCRFAIATARAENDPTYALRGALPQVRAKHVPAIVESSEFGELVRQIWKYDGAPSTRSALRLIALLYPRPGELRRARWDEFDLDRKVWTIPPEHEKNRRKHAKPLSDFSVHVLKEQKSFSGHLDLVFPAVGKLQRPLCENTMNQALRKLGYKGLHTSHGFRSSASSLLNESGLWSPDAIEAELCHIDGNQSRRPYHRARYWEERIKMSEYWAQLIHSMTKNID